MSLATPIYGQAQHLGSRASSEAAGEKSAAPLTHFAAKRGGSGGQRNAPRDLGFCGGWICLFLFFCRLAAMAGESPAEAQFATHARRIYEEARKEHSVQPTNSALAWKFARACFDSAEFAKDNEERAELAQQGIAACREVIARDPKSGAAHYYLGMNLGQLARTRGLSALKLVNEMEKEFSLAASLDDHFDFAGPDRNLGLLYRDAPSFGSIGSRSKARKHLTRAAELAPDYPENRLSLMESDIKWNDLNSARHELKLLEGILPKARTNLVGEDWASSWADWNPRLEEAKKKIEAPPKSLDAHKRS